MNPPNPIPPAAPHISTRPALSRRRFLRGAGIVMALPLLDSMTTVIPLRTVAEHAAAILKGQVRGRLVVDVNR